ncbi:MAG: AAA family ATPase [Coriobacteriales bacterium]|jgi:hypothetical protein
MKEAFIAYVGQEVSSEEIEKALRESNKSYDYTVKALVCGEHDEAKFGKVVYDSYADNRRDPEIGGNLIGVGGYDLELLHQVTQQLAGGRYDPHDRDADQRVPRLLYADFGTDAFDLLAKQMPFSFAAYSLDSHELVAARGRDLDEEESYANLFYGNTPGGDFIFSNDEELLTKFCAQVFPVAAYTYYKDGAFVSYRHQDQARSDDAGIRANYLNARDIISSVNAILEQTAKDTLQERIDSAFENYFKTLDPEKKVEEYVSETLDEQIRTQLSAVIDEQIDSLCTREAIDARLDESYRERFDLFVEKTATPQVNVIKLNDVEIARIDAAFYHQKYEQVLTQVRLNEPVMLIGPAGSGKNYAVSQVAEALGLDMHYTNNASNEFKLTGFIDAGGSYHETEFYRAFKYGGIFFLDEIDNSDPAALIVINSALANGYMAFPNETIDVHPDFRCVAAANTWGAGSDLQYVGRNALDAATLDRFDMVFFDYDRRLEQALYPDEELLEFMWALRRAVATSHIPHIVSTRAIGKCYKKRKYGMDLETILRTNVIRGLSQDDLNILIGSIRELDEANPFYRTIKTMRVER